MDSDPNVFSYWGRYLLSEHNKLHEEVLPNTKLSDLTPMLGYTTGPRSAESKLSITERQWTTLFPVCIIGAGIAGLYTAMILESLGIRYQIVEANTEERVGGRLFTYHFPGGGPYDYFDVGPMAFPRSPFMKRTFDLIENRCLEGVKLIPYIMEAKNTKKYFGGTHIDNRIAGEEIKKVQEVLHLFRSEFEKPWQSIEKSIISLVEGTDTYSMKGYMFACKIDPRKVRWCETVTTHTGVYDHGLLQVVLDSLATDWPRQTGTSRNPDDIWECIDGGSSRLPKAMFNSLSKTPSREAFDSLPEGLPKEIFQILLKTVPEDLPKGLPETMLNSLPDYMKETVLFKSSVTAITRITQEVPDWDDQAFMRVSIDSKLHGKVEIPYSAVISTIPLPRLGLVDLSEAEIQDNSPQWGAIRELEPMQVFKIGIRFSAPWWETEFEIHGGQSVTDLPSRRIVYPSHPEKGEPEERSRVLIVSCCRAYDAQRFGGLIHPDGKADPELIDRVFRDLAAVHGKSVEHIKQFYKEGDYFAWNWTQDPLSLGAFGSFGPGTLGGGGIYTALVQPAAHGKLFFAGESASACQGWVAGALNSAWRAVDQYLQASGQSDLRKQFHGEWGATEFWDETPQNRFAEEYHKLTDRHFVIALARDGVKPRQTQSAMVPV